MEIRTIDYVPHFGIGLQESGVCLFHDLVKLDRGNLICLAARPGMGKTALALHMALEYAEKSGKAVFIFSMDLTAEQLYERMISALSGVETRCVRERRFAERDGARVRKAIEKLRKLRVIIEDDKTLTVRQMLERAQGVDALGAVIVDAPQLMGEGEIGAENCRALRSFCARKNLPVVFTYPLDRSVEKRKDKRPRLQDVAAHVGRDADTVLCLYRDEYYHFFAKDHSSAELILAKNRYATPATVLLEWCGRCSKFGELPREHMA